MRLPNAADHWSNDDKCGVISALYSLRLALIARIRTSPSPADEFELADIRRAEELLGLVPK